MLSEVPAASPAPRAHRQLLPLPAVHQCSSQGAVRWSLWGLPLPRPLQEHALQQDTLSCRDTPSKGHAPLLDTLLSPAAHPFPAPTARLPTHPQLLPAGGVPHPGVLPMEDQDGKMGGGIAVSQLDANFEGSTLLGVRVCLKMLLKYYFFLLYQFLD